jgi:RNA polymerase sigma-70 factor, ECF subfamily
MALMSGEIDFASNGLFGQLVAENQRALFLYILTLLPHPTEAEEVLQETNLTMLRSASDFEIGSNFRAWAFRIAYHRVLQFRQGKQRESLTFDTELVDTLAQEARRNTEMSEARSHALSNCLKKLRPSDLSLLSEYYRVGANRAGIAQQIQRPLGSIYKSMTRIRKSLMRCIMRQIASEDRA